MDLNRHKQSRGLESCALEIPQYGLHLQSLPLVVMQHGEMMNHYEKGIQRYDAQIKHSPYFI